MTVGETLATIAANHAGVDAVFFTNLPAYVFVRPTSTALRIAFATARSTLAPTKPTRAAKMLIHISTRPTLANSKPGTSPVVVCPKS